IKAADEGAGVLLIIKNYSGDVMNFEMAREMAEMEEIKVEQIIVDDDIAVENSLYTQGRRGVAGTVLVHKILGAAAHQGASLDEIKDLADKVVKNIKTIGLALSAATVPEVGKPGFVLDEDEIEYGVGIHSEPGYRREKMKTSYE
ncbi:dihydroxyacetone kinase subunit DhaK, partial [Bradyrhizobium sp. BRP05]|nr:dihydroxyacetone kinase subunit DhaK [Bradyrhizobium sp. BRP05]